MTQQQPQELCARDGSERELPGLGVAVPKGHLGVVAGDKVFLLDHAAVEIAPEITTDLRDQSYRVAKLGWGFTVFFTA